MLKEFLLPPGGLILGALALMLVFRRRRSTCLAVLGLVLGALYMLSTPYLSRALIRSLQWYPPLVLRAAQPADAIIVLSAGRDRDTATYGGDTVDALSLERLRFAARLHRASGLPLLVSGGPPVTSWGRDAMAALMADALARDFGVEARWREEASTDTRENAILSARLLHDEPIRRVYVVTHAWHLPRAMMAFGATGLEAVPAAASHVPPARFNAEALVPNAPALANSAYALHEWLGIGKYLLYYGFRPVHWGGMR